uniref:Uncharacterized protein n=1 Tax=Myotis myotis TaxID=51298 RepID=A0A7J7VZ09_MYOMY|nr:hypothetical protein mMyoMyo1_012234 [Myotis myotis]
MHWRGCPSARPAPSHSPGSLRGGRRPGNQGKAMPHHTSAAATVGSASLSQPWLPEPRVALGGWAATIRGLPVPRASLGLRGLGTTILWLWVPPSLRVWQSISIFPTYWLWALPSLRAWQLSYSRLIGCGH